MVCLSRKSLVFSLHFSFLSLHRLFLLTSPLVSLSHFIFCHECWLGRSDHFPIHTLLSIHTYFFSSIFPTILNCMWAIVYFHHVAGTRRFCCRMLWNVLKNVNWKMKKQAQMKWNYLNIVLMISGARTRKKRIQTNKMKKHEKKPLDSRYDIINKERW